MNYEEQVKELLGEKAYNMFLDAVESGVVDVQQMTDIAVRLHKNVGGEFKHAKSSQNFHLDRVPLVRSSPIGTNAVHVTWTKRQRRKSSSPLCGIKTYNSTRSQMR